MRKTLRHDVHSLCFTLTLTGRGFLLLLAFLCCCTFLDAHSGGMLVPFIYLKVFPSTVMESLQFINLELD